MPPGKNCSSSSSSRDICAHETCPCSVPFLSFSLPVSPPTRSCLQQQQQQQQQQLADLIAREMIPGGPPGAPFVGERIQGVANEFPLLLLLLPSKNNRFISSPTDLRYNNNKHHFLLLLLLLLLLVVVVVGLGLGVVFTISSPSFVPCRFCMHAERDRNNNIQP